MGEVREIDLQPAGNPQVIERLEEALDQARRGEVSSVAIAIVNRDGTVQASWSSASSAPLLLASIERLRHKLHRLIDGEAK